MVKSINSSLVSGSNGALTKNSTNMAAWGGTLGTNYSSNIPSSSMVIAPGESITYQSYSSGTVAINTNTQLFQFAAMDSTSVAGTAKAVNVTLMSSTGQVPTFGYVGPILIPSKTNGVTIQIPYLQFRAHADAHDIDEPAGSLGMYFRINSITTTNGSVTMSDNGGGCGAITVNTTLFGPGDFICFTPDANGAALGTDVIHTILTLQPLNYSNNANPGLTARGLQIRMP